MRRTRLRWFGLLYAWDILPFEPYCGVTDWIAGWVEDCALDGALLRTRHGERSHQQGDGSEKGLEIPAFPGFKTTRRSGRTIHKATRLLLSREFY